MLFVKGDIARSIDNHMSSGKLTLNKTYVVVEVESGYVWCFNDNKDLCIYRSNRFEKYSRKDRIDNILK